jgi:uncharacterized membrane protein YdjX (TVP38/TMEM64 family)
MIQFTLARRGALEWDVESRLERLPRFLRKLPVEHPLFLICVRWLPMGFHIANIAAAVRGVSPTRQLWTAAVGSLPGALMWAAIGAGISIL